MNFLSNYSQFIYEGIISFIVLYIIYKMKTRKPRLIYYLTNMASFLLSGRTPMVIGTHTIMIQNTSKIRAEEIEVCHTSAQQYFQVYPDVPHEIITTPQGGQIIKFRDLTGKNTITISYLYVLTSDSPSYLPQYARSKDGFIKEISTIHSPIFPKWVNFILITLMFLGFVFLINLIVELIKIII